MLDYFLAASCTYSDLNFCKSSTISFPTSWKRHKFCKVFNAFVISVELGLTTGYIIFFTVFVWGPFLRSLKAWHFSPKLFTLSFGLTEVMLLPEWFWKKERTNFRTKFCRCNYKHSNINHSKTSFESSSQPKNDWRGRENCST